MCLKLLVWWDSPDWLQCCGRRRLASTPLPYMKLLELLPLLYGMLLLQLLQATVVIHHPIHLQYVCC